MGNIRVQSFTFNAFQENTFVVSDKKGHALVFDPGCYTRSEEQALKDYLDNNSLSLKALLNTHCHIDHVLGNHFISSSYEIDLGIHEEEKAALLRVKDYAHVYGFEGYLPSPDPTYFVADQQDLKIGDLHMKVLHTPGHSPGHVVFYFEKEGFVINGDVLFQGSFGRTDLPGGDMDTLRRSIFETLFELPNDTLVYCGHGPHTTIGQEKKTNYILQF